MHQLHRRPNFLVQCRRHHRRRGLRFHPCHPLNDRTQKCWSKCRPQRWLPTARGCSTPNSGELITNASRLWLVNGNWLDLTDSRMQQVLTAMNTVLSETACCWLRIRRSVWERTLRQLVSQPNAWASGRLRREGAHNELLLLADDLQLTATTPTGLQRPPLDDWLVLMYSDGHFPAADQLLALLQPRAAQVLVVLVLDRQHPDRCLLCSFTNGRTGAVELCEISGTGMLQLRASVPTATSRAEDLRRSSRTRGALGTELHDRLRRSIVTVVGAGRSGSQLCFLLAGLGVGRLRLIDADVLLPENLDGMPGLTSDDLYLNKAAVLARRLTAFQPELSVTCVEHQLPTREAAAYLLRPCSLMVSTVDNDAARLAVSLLANRTLTPHLDIGTLVRLDSQGRPSLFADVRLLLPGSCVSCVGGLADPDAAYYALNAPDGSLQRGTPVDWSVQRAGSLVHLNTLACSLGVELWLRLLRGEIESWWQRVAWEAAGELHMTGTAVAGQGTCELCRGR